MKYAGRYLVEDDLFVLYIQGMTRVGSALETGYQVIAGCEKIHDLSLSFIAPLEA